VLVEERQFEEKTTGGIVLPGNTINEGQKGEYSGIVLALSKKAFDYEPEERPDIGDVVYFRKYEGYAFVLNGINYRFILDEIIYAKSKTYLNKEESIFNG
jgi:co-chaperonin GroES (HSP10)